MDIKPKEKVGISYTCEDMNTVKIERECLNFFSEAIFIYCDEKIVAANDKALKIVGAKDISEIQGLQAKVALKILPEYEEAADKRLREIQEGRCVPPLEEKFTRLDGKVLDLEISGTPHIYRGKPGAMIIINDITEKKKIKQELKDVSDKYSMLVEMSPDGIFILDNSKVIFANEAGAKLLGFKNAIEIEGVEYKKFIYPECKSNLYINGSSFEEEGKHWVTGEYKIIKSNGGFIDIEASYTKINYEGKRVILSICRDITSRKKAESDRIQLESALEYDKIKTEFFSNISHELKTPLNIILSCIQLLDYKESKKSIKPEKYIGMMRQNCYRLLRLINNLIDITRMDAGFLNMNMKNSNIVEIIEDIVLSVAEYIQCKGLSIIFDTDTEEIITACDEDKIERIVLNLLSNAIKFTNSGGEILVSVTNKVDSLEFSIKDTGIGIPQDMLDRIFDRFKQVDPLFTRNKEGSGIGLSLVKSLVEAQGGRIKVKSEQGRGSEFIVEMPIKLISDSKTDKKAYMEQEKVERISIEFSDIYEIYN